jgi:hypothetical protein
MPSDATLRLSRQGDRQWIIPAAAVVLCQYIVATVLSRSIGFGGGPQLGYMPIALVVSLLGGSVIVLPATWRLWREGEARPIARLIREADLNAVATYLIGFQLIALEFGALTWLKNMLPAVIPYWADPALASLDRAILGTDAWRLFPQTLTGLFDIVYTTWFPVHMLTVICILCLKPSPAKIQSLFAYFLTVGLMGVCGQYLLSSGGPIFYDRIVGGDGFADLLGRIDAHAKFTAMAQEFLWTSYSARANEFGNGISAMPSIHVATTAWIALALSSVWPRLRLPVWTYWFAIFLGSFALGWHYFLDGVVGTAGALGCWVLARRMLARDTEEGESCTLAPIG